MPAWIQRYRSGGHAEVWAEMQALGGAIHKPAHRKAAQEVCRETFGRCRRNVLWLFQALPQIGYRFHGAPAPAAPDYPLELRIFGALQLIEANGGSKYRSDPWSHPALAWVEEEEIELPAHHRTGRPGRANYRPPSARAPAVLDEIERRLGGPLPLAQRCWFETVGSVDLAGAHPMLNRTGEGAPLRIVLESEGHGLAASPDAGAPFVASLRQAFDWAGFPGWSGRPDPPERELAFLRSNLAPF